ncbi:hypothetical protein L6258_02640 [Candidatus Parcubacteria bacterium]|nr:hypothetical protein [Candidatus Parcubacteria bacterium]
MKRIQAFFRWGERKCPTSTKRRRRLVEMAKSLDSLIELDITGGPADLSHNMDEYLYGAPIKCGSRKIPEGEQGPGP